MAVHKSSQDNAEDDCSSMYVKYDEMQYRVSVMSVLRVIVNS